ncbi:hypothetical protein KY465_03720 [Pseudohoeflea sp. DP4N28-3]|uniref:LPXTG cell wall anchor domain-containing protein n=1 Tax=Pseudohoeflea coraliihabitans TaxID=2860393 RepID=A0ABS6WKA5_9HYPH|nr:hypothetical protein [Pseudohoeflea sp. DP4N28-3]MBW3096384.1 hypothetical protein [Pseudohoeflea sp. DP4N28-3]
MNKSDKSALLAAAAILAATFAVFYLMPGIMTSLGAVSPVLAIAAGVAAVLAFFAVFWLRGRYRRGSGASDRDESGS